MAEQKLRYMQQLDEWTQEFIIDPLYKGWAAVENAPDEVREKSQAELTEVALTVKKAVRERVLQSYRNRQKAGPPRAQRFQNKQQKRKRGSWPMRGWEPGFVVDFVLSFGLLALRCFRGMDGRGYL